MIGEADFTMLLISGFGGSGKTRLVRSLIRQQEKNGLDSVVVINDTKLMLRSKGQHMSKDRTKGTSEAKGN